MKYSIFRAPLFSFFSKSFYSDTAKIGKGTGFLYLFVVLLFCFPLSLASRYFQFAISLDSNVELAEMMTKLPDLRVSHGSLTINKASPYRMAFKNAVTKKDTLVIFDTSGKTTTTDEAQMILTDKGIMFDGQSQLLPWSIIPNDFELSAAKFKDFARTIVLGLTLLGLFLLPLVWFVHVILALIYGVVGLIMDRHKLGYVTALRMTVVAMTPTVLLTTLLSIFFCTPDLEFFLLVWQIITVPITLVYLFFGYNSINTSASDLPS